MKMSDKFEELETELKNGNFEKVEQIYRGLEKEYNNHKVITDFSNDYNMETGEIVNSNSIIESMPAYQINARGDLVKSYGQDQQDWSSAEEFIEDATNKDLQQNLVLSPNVDLSSNEEKFTRIFSPSTQKDKENFYFIKPKLSSTISSSDNSLIQNSLNQIKSLSSEIDFILVKRNQLNQYYIQQLEEANRFEQESIEKISSQSLSQVKVEEANRLSLESKKSFYKASFASSLIKQFDQSIAQQSILIDESVQSVKDMQSDLEKNMPDEALVKNVQMQRKYVAHIKAEINDSAFNYSVNELFIPIPQIFSEEENQEFLVINGQVQRNDQVNLNQFFYQNTSQIAVDINTIPALRYGKPDIEETLVENQNQEIVDYTTPKQNEEHQTNLNIIAKDVNKVFSSNSLANNDDIPLTGGVQISNPMDEDSSMVKEKLELKSINVQNFKSDNDIRNALGTLNLQAQAHLVEVDLVQKRLAISAEGKLNKSNGFSLQLESINNPVLRKPINDSAKYYLYQALALKEVSDDYQVYLNEERNIKDKITQYTFDIEKDIEQNNLVAAKAKFVSMQTGLSEFKYTPAFKLQEIQSNLLAKIQTSRNRMDSAYSLSQELANESVKLLSEASEEREEAERKRNAFKRREALKFAVDKEIKATKFQNDSEKALALGNSLHEEQQVLLSLVDIQPELLVLTTAPLQNNNLIVNQELVFQGIEQRKSEVFGRKVAVSNLLVVEERPLNSANTSKVASSKAQITEDDLHVYERENFKAEMLTEELELIKREIALLVQSQGSSLSNKESYIITHKINILRQKADSLEYEANRVFDLADRILETLSEEEQREAQKSSRDFNKYLSDLKDKIEVLLSEASSLKQRAQRSNNIQTREDLYKQAKNKEEVAMYLILEEFEVIAQKNKTRYRKNQLILEQLMMDLASAEERELMRNIFSQIDNYFEQAQQKRQKANQPGISFSMKKILLQDAYSLEMKALDLQQQGKTMIEDHDVDTMMAYQVESDEEKTLTENITATNQSNNNQQTVALNPNTTEVIVENTPIITTAAQKPNASQKVSSAQEENEELIVNNQGVSSQVKNLQKNPQVEQEVGFVSASTDGVVYRVQFTALKVLKKETFFNRISDISAERVTGTDFIRYFSGNFEEMDPAIIRRNALRASGYPDAFIRSWKDGEVVTLLSLQEETGTSTSAINSVAVVRRTSVGNIDFSATNISSLQGVYYTVQIGVYSRPRTSAMIYGIKPLYHKRMQNGYWIYYSGIFNSIADATTKKDEIVEQGVKDAFVVAFSNGISVGLAKARQQISQGEDAPDDEDIVILEDASLQIDNQWDMSQEAGLTASSGIEYKVQVGVYSNPINLSWIATQVDGNYSVDSYKNSNGKYVYTIGHFKDDAEARTLLKEIKDIIPDAFVVGFQDGNKKYIR
ncbi:hypothetical protein HNS38_02085 [Lentimicrobium sp. L6]|uniref:SPOR domain-containing protein n=1 Tax=Lentimicrobium sp. L6 TaxID=2735916 RepID=UPI0015554EF6|nr:SPOR domain-containing protein [Lentimicrobium sp. L6]NPD83531.1 hypothetical protein [Lentimicrobium sp. L6]